jgi:hypothetical protein
MSYLSLSPLPRFRLSMSASLSPPFSRLLSPPFPRCRLSLSVSLFPPFPRGRLSLRASHFSRHSLVVVCLSARLTFPAIPAWSSVSPRVSLFPPFPRCRLSLRASHFSRHSLVVVCLPRVSVIVARSLQAQY